MTQPTVGGVDEFKGSGEGAFSPQPILGHSTPEKADAAMNLPPETLLAIAVSAADLNLEYATRLRAEVKRLRAALEQYANHDKWGFRPIRGYPDGGLYIIWYGVNYHGWDIAERALAKESQP